MPKLGTVIRRLRDARGLTQMRLAKKARVSHGYVGALEAGIRHNPSLPTLRRLARALGVPVGELLE
jgi:transcriptional regulator with XRE-family HTH domain